MLDQFETKLDLHFKSLGANKAAHGREDPVFLLEHPLLPAETQSLGTLLGQSLLDFQCMHHGYRLCWLVHATEVGYVFEGLEYWATFARRTESWQTYGDRGTLRRWFIDFASSYGSAKPAGTWAEHYKFICWPVTHAVVPLDMQVQLANTLFQARHALRSASALTPADVGRLIERHAYAPSSRFAGFLQRHGLVGRVVKALLQGAHESVTPIYAPALERITADINSKRDAREWLKDAQRHYTPQSFYLPGGHDRFRVSSGPGPMSLGKVVGNAIVNWDVALLAFCKLELRANGGSWRPFLLIPSFLALSEQVPEIRAYLKGGHFSVPVHNVSVWPSEGLLTGQQRARPLGRWPKPREALINFQSPPAIFIEAVGPELRFDNASIWLFKLREGGLASQIQSLTVRAGGQYLVLTRESSVLGSMGRPIAIECEDIHGLLLDLPAQISHGDENDLRRIGLNLQRTITVQPVGLWPRGWAGDDLGEWLTTETPRFSLSRDHFFDTYCVQINDEPAIHIRCNGTEPVFFAFPGLIAGVHRITISTHSTTSTRGATLTKTAAHSTWPLTVREPTRWIPGSLCHPALVVDLDIVNPTLEDLVFGRLHVQVQGDVARGVACRLELQDAAGEVISNTLLITHQLPITSDIWGSVVPKAIEGAGESIDFFSADVAQLVVDSVDFGNYRIDLTVDVQPMRWVFNREQNLRLRLINEGVEGDTTVTYRDFVRPQVSQLLRPNEANVGIELSNAEGLFVAKTSGLALAVVACRAERGHSFDWLGVQVDHAALEAIQEPADLILAHSEWCAARPSNALAYQRKRQVIKELHKQMLRAVCGAYWIAAEESAVNASYANRWERLEGAVMPHKSPSYAIALSRVCEIGAGSLQGRHARVSKSFHLVVSDTLLEAAWLLATQPQRLDHEFTMPIEQSQKDHFTTLVRGARLVQLRHELTEEQAS